MMNWKVIETCQASKFEKPFEREIAQFDTLVLAEDFIDLVIPKDTKDRFRIEHIKAETLRSGASTAGRSPGADDWQTRKGTI